MRLVEGLPQGAVPQAAALYWQAFRGKLSRLMGPDARAIAFFEATLNPASVIAAMDGDQLLGIAAFKQNGQGFSRAGFADLWRAYGLGSLWRLGPLAMLERNAAPGVLQMDGICVAEQARGRGVGTALFQALFAKARRDGYRAITLDVIDSNPRARALYERLGFQATGTDSTGPLRGLLGFDSATKMQLQLTGPDAPPRAAKPDRP